MLLYEAFQSTLWRELPNARFFVYVDYIASITQDKARLCQIFARVQQLSDSLGLKVNRSKTEIYVWDRRAPKGHIDCPGDRIPVQPPIFKYLGHTLAHPSWVHKAHNNFLEGAQTELATYERPPLNAWERAGLVNTVLTPRWTHRLLLIPNDITYKQLGKSTKEFVTNYKGLEKICHTTKMSTPVKEGGMGLHQQFRASRKRVVTVIQRLLRDRHPKCNPWGHTGAPRALNPRYFFLVCHAAAGRYNWCFVP